MNCIESESIASAYLDQQMTQSEVIKYHAHLENCADCQAYLAELREMSLMIGSVRQPEVPAELCLRIMSAVTDEKFRLFAQREAARETESSKSSGTKRLSEYRSVSRG